MAQKRWLLSQGEDDGSKGSEGCKGCEGSDCAGWGRAHLLRSAGLQAGISFGVGCLEIDEGISSARTIRAGPPAPQLQPVRRSQYRRRVGQAKFRSGIQAALDDCNR